MPIKSYPAVVIACSILALWIGFINSYSHAMGPESNFLSLPEQGASSAGFTLTITAEELRLFGDVPVNMSLSPTGGPFPADRELVIRINLASRTTQPPGRDCVYELPIAVKQGDRTINKIFYLPKWSVGGELDVAVIEDRRAVPGYDGRLSGMRATAAQSEWLWTESAESRFGWIVDDDKDQPDLRVLLAMLGPELLNLNDIASSPGFEFGKEFKQFRITKREDAPTDWRGFDTADVWMIEPATLRLLFEKNPTAFKALRHYLLCGGSLWVVGDVSETDLNQWFHLPPPIVPDLKKTITSVVDMIKTNFNVEQVEDYRASNNASYGISRPYLRDLALRRNANNQINSTPPTLTSVYKLFDDNKSWLKNQENTAGNPVGPQDFMLRLLGLGSIVICKSQAPFPGTCSQWLTMVSLTPSGASETAVRGVDPCFGDRRFWDWTVPDVAQPPVYAFIGLLLAFTIVVGPVSYRYFTRLGRGYLMMFVAPLLALATTLLLFAYGLVADGLSTQARIREVTWIGDTAQNGFRYSRSTYFAGVSPAEGLAFPADSIVLSYQLPTVESWLEASAAEHSTIGTIRFGDDKIRFDRGFLPSRQQKQFVTYRPIENLGSLSFKDASRKEGDNSTKLDLRDGVICDLDGQYFSFDISKANASFIVRPLLKSEAGEALSKLYTLQRPIAPAGVSSSRRQGEYTIDLIAKMQTQSPRRGAGSLNATNGESRIEAWLRSSLQIGSTLPPGTFVALSEVTDDCIAAPVSELRESIHYVIGVLR